MPQGSRPEYRVRTEKNVPATMRDGVTLYADVYRPDSEGRFPVILLRLRYGKHMAEVFGDHEYFPSRGYVVVVQDGRGRFESEGEYYALIDEAQDGYDSVEWAASLPYSNGMVGTQGQSYLGATQYQLAPTRPPHLRCAFPVSAAADVHQGWTYHTGGAFSLGWQVPSMFRTICIAMAQPTACRAMSGSVLSRPLRKHLTSTAMSRLTPCR